MLAHLWEDDASPVAWRADSSMLLASSDMTSSASLASDISFVGRLTRAGTSSGWFPDKQEEHHAYTVSYSDTPHIGLPHPMPSSGGPAASMGSVTPRVAHMRPRVT